jgi:hypothetical protein
VAEPLPVKLTVADVLVMPLAARAVGALQAGAAVLKLVLAAAEVWPPAQLLTMFTVYAVLADKPVRVAEVPVTVWVVVAGTVATV